jgi:hypothetical protein
MQTVELIMKAKLGAKPRALVSVATTGAAAAVFGGNTRTIHSAFGITTRSGDRDANGALEPLHYQKLAVFQELYENTDVIVIDEVSMLTTTLIGDLHMRCQQITGNKDLPFGGFSIVLVGDYQQLPPACGTPSYTGVLKSLNLASENVSAHEKKSRKLFMLFKITFLTEFKRCTDPLLMGFLSGMRDLHNTYPLENMKLITELKKLVATPEDLENKFSDAVTCVLSNTERFAVNRQIVELKAKELRDVLVTWDNEITTPADIPGELEQALRDKYSASLVGCFLKGAPVVLTTNLAPVIQVANGSNGVLESIIYLDASVRDATNKAIHAASPGTIVKLERPNYVVVKMNQKISSSGENNEHLNLAKKLFPGRKDHAYLVPLPYEKDRFKKNYIQLGTKAKPSMLRYKRFNYDLGFSVTAYKLQGATIKYLLVDLNQRPLGLKAILSRVEHMTRIRIMPFRPHVSNPKINKDNFLDYLKNLKQCPDLAAWKECIDPVTLLFDPVLYKGPTSKSKKSKVQQQQQ